MSNGKLRKNINHTGGSGSHGRIRNTVCPTLSVVGLVRGIALARGSVLRAWRGSAKSIGPPVQFRFRVVPRLHVLLARPLRRTINGLIKGTWSSSDAGVADSADEGSAMGSLWRRLVDIGGTQHPLPLLWAVWPEDSDPGCHTPSPLDGASGRL